MANANPNPAQGRNHVNFFQPALIDNPAARTRPVVSRTRDEENRETHIGIDFQNENGRRIFLNIVLSDYRAVDEQPQIGPPRA